MNRFKSITGTGTFWRANMDAQLEKIYIYFSTMNLFHKNGNIASKVFELKVQLTKVSPETEHQNILDTGCRGVCNDQ